jgi:hypothetical protein
MAKKKKLFTYSFIDCKKEFNSSIIVRCTKTGEKVKMYHKQLYKLIKNKYNNNYSLFKASYVKKGNNIVEEGDEYNFAPERYKKYLLTAYMCLFHRKDVDDLTKSQKLSFLSDCYSKRYEDNIYKILKKAELI